MMRFMGETLTEKEIQVYRGEKRVTINGIFR